MTLGVAGSNPAVLAIFTSAQAEKEFAVSKEQLEAAVRHAAWSAAATFSINEAISMLQRVTRELEDKQWEGPGNR